MAHPEADVYCGSTLLVVLACRRSRIGHDEMDHPKIHPADVVSGKSLKLLLSDVIF